MPTTITTDTDTNAWVQRLLHILEQQQALLTRLSDLAGRQGSLVRNRRTDALLSVLGERQQIIDRFLVLQNDMGGLTEDLNERLETIDEPRRERIRALIKEIGEALDVVMRQDEQDRRALEASRDETKKELTGVGTATRARQAYLAAGGPKPRFADRQG